MDIIILAKELGALVAPKCPIIVSYPPQYEGVSESEHLF
jgi:hypothetical protein